MLYLTIPKWEGWNEKEERFVSVPETKLCLEHSLVSLSRWESKWNKPFLGRQQKTEEEMIDYIRCMTITQNVPDEVYSGLTKENVNAIRKYIDAPMTATKFKEEKNEKKKSGEKITSELIYYWMIASNIPFECQKWHLNRLLTLIRICGVKNKPPKKMGRAKNGKYQSALNAMRKERMNSRG